MNTKNTFSDILFAFTNGIIYDNKSAIKFTKKLFLFAHEKGLTKSLSITDFTDFCFKKCQSEQSLNQLCQKDQSFKVQISSFLKENRPLSEEIRTIISYAFQDYWHEISAYSPNKSFDTAFYEDKLYKNRSKKPQKIRKYLGEMYIRLQKPNGSFSNMRLKNYIWEQNNMPKFNSDIFCIDHKDGNKLNCEISNLFLIQKRFRTAINVKPTANIDNPTEAKTIEIERGNKISKTIIVVVLGTRYVPYEYFLVRYVFGFKEIDSAVHSVVFKDGNNRNFEKSNLMVVVTKNIGTIIKDFGK